MADQLNDLPQPDDDHFEALNEAAKIMPYQTAGFKQQLQQFMAQPTDVNLERRFASALLNMSFYVPVQVRQKAMTSKEPNAHLGMGMAVITYLADGQRYIPAFTERSEATRFLVGSFPEIDFRMFEFTSEELMTEAGQLKIAGLLVNPGIHNFPLSITYWNYIHRVRPLPVTTSQADFQFRLLGEQSVQLEAALSRAMRRYGKLKKAWLFGVRYKGKTTLYDRALIVDWQGDQEQFRAKVEPKLAIVAHRHQRYGTDFLIGTTTEFIGREVEAEFDPFYTRRGGLQK